MSLKVIPHRMQPKALRLRRAAASDVQVILDLEAASFAQACERFGRRQVRRLIANPRARVILAQARGRRALAWSAGLLRRSRRRSSGRIYALAVCPAGRGLGIGERLMLDMIRALRRRGAEKIYLEVRSDNAPAIGLYRKLGFVDCRHLPDYYRLGLHGRRMVLPGKVGRSLSVQRPRRGE